MPKVTVYRERCSWAQGKQVCDCHQAKQPGGALVHRWRMLFGVGRRFAHRREAWGVFLFIGVH